jgi:hypothetical protein
MQKQENENHLNIKNKQHDCLRQMESFVPDGIGEEG